MNGFPGLRNQILCNTQRIVEFQLQAGCIIERGSDVSIQVVEAAGFAQSLALIRVRFWKRALCQPGWNREKLRRIAQDVCSMFENKGLYFAQGGIIFDDIRLVEDEDNFLAPGENPLEELAFAFRHGMIGWSGEQDQVTAGDIFICQAFVMADDSIGAGRIDNIELLEERQWIGVDRKVFVNRLLRNLLPPFDQGHARGGGCGALR